MSTGPVIDALRASVDARPAPRGHTLPPTCVPWGKPLARDFSPSTRVVTPAHRRLGRLGRPRRVLLLLAGVWALHVFDLCFTMQEARSLLFTELNPLAERLLHGPPHVLVTFKFGLLSIGTAILLWFRKHSIVEWACWFLLATSFYVTVRWYVYFADAIKVVGTPMH